MSNQNIYDNEIFFNQYKKLRESDVNYNDLLEQPAMEKLIPDISEKAVLDLGCGYGINCINFIKKGAKKVVGIDISKKMLEIANEKYSDEKIKYVKMDMNDIQSLNEKYDLIYSSLAFHYIEDFNKFTKVLYSMLNNDGYLLFSQEHPFVTATFDGKQHYNNDNNGDFVSYTFSNYGQPGKRETFWFVDGVVKYHRRFSDIITSLSNAGFIIDTVLEPLPDQSAIKKIPSILIKEQIKPTFLIIKAIKKG